MRKKIFIIIIPIVIALVAFVGVYRYYNKEDKTTTLTVTEKRWVEENAEQAFDFEIVNDYPLYGMNGEGVIFNFIADFEESVGMQFNKIPYLKNAGDTTEGLRVRILDGDEKLSDKDLPLFTDSYVAVGKTYQRINHVKDMKNMTIGVFKEDSEDISYYLKSGTNLSYNTYETIEELYQALDNSQVEMIVVPNIMYLDYIINSDKYVINYFFTEYQKQIVLTLDSQEDKVNTIVEKYYNKWRYTKYVEEYNAAYLKYYLEKNELSAKEKSALVSKTYTYGYVDNEPYELKVHSKLAGIAGEYVNRMARLGNIEFKYKKFSSKKALEKAIDKGTIDIYFDYYNYDNENYLSTISTFVEDYVVLGKQEDNHVINSFESLKDKKVLMLNGDALHSYFESNSKAKIKEYNSLDTLLNKADSNLIVLDYEIYSYYQNNKLKNYKLLYKDTMMNDYKFMVHKDNKEFYDLFNYIINTNSYYNYRNTGIENLHASILEDSTFEQVYTIILIILFVPLIVLGIAYLIIKKKNEVKKIKATDRHKYTDMLTSLKNRNYLNAKMAEWEDSKVFPQSIVMVDLNNVKYVNDNYGHEEGDQLIIKAAGILVNTQLENSEVIRTDGNEFLIYLVGYSDRQIATYTKKLEKEMKSLPHEFGAAVGYSMITDEIKTLDDAINEATLEMITNKEEYK